MQSVCEQLTSKRKGKSDIYGTVLAKTGSSCTSSACPVFNHVSKSLAEVCVRCKMCF
jgi:hypothetical protein